MGEEVVGVVAAVALHYPLEYQNYKEIHQKATLRAYTPYH